MSGSYIFARVYSALAQREGRKTTLPTLVSMTGLTATQIQNTIANARRTSEVHARQIEVVNVGRAWKFKADSSVGGYQTPDDVVKAVEVGSKHIWKLVLAALVQNAGKVTHKNTLAELASTPEREITPLQAANAMQTIMRQPSIAPKIEVMWAENAWRYVEPKSTTEPVEAAVPHAAKNDAVKSVSAPIRGSVLRYFSQKPGSTVFVDDIVNDLGFTKKQVQSAVWHLLNENEATKNDFIIISGGYAWQYVPNRALKAEVDAEAKVELNGHAPAALEQVPARVYTPETVATTPPATPKVSTTPAPQPVAVATTTGRLFEEIGQLPGDAVLVKESESGAIYRATPLA